MKLEEFLEKVRECPDEKLDEEFGVGSNFPIHFRCDYDRMSGLFLANRKWVFRGGEGRLRSLLRERKNRHNFFTGFYFVDFHVCAHVHDEACPRFDLIMMNLPRNEDFEILVSQYSERYNGHIVLHPHYHKHCDLLKPKSFPEQCRNVVTAIEDISKMIIEERIPACFFKIGTNYRGSNLGLDVKFSRVAYFDPEKSK